MGIKGTSRPKNDKTYSIDHDREACIGCGACAAVTSNWFMEDDGKASAKVVDFSNLGDEKEAAEGCPVNCIHLIDNKAKKKLI